MRGYFASQIFSFLFLTIIIQLPQKTSYVSFLFFFFCRYRRGSGCDEYRVDLRHSRLPLPPRRGVSPISRCKHTRCIRTHTSCMHVCSDVFVCLCLEFFLAVSPCSQLSRPCIIFHIAHFWIFYFSLFSSYSLEFACVCFLNLFRGLQR